MMHKVRVWLCLLRSSQHFYAADIRLLAYTPVDLIFISCCPKPHLHLYCVLLGAAGTTCQTCSTRLSTAPGKQRAAQCACSALCMRAHPGRNMLSRVLLLTTDAAQVSLLPDLRGGLRDDGAPGRRCTDAAAAARVLRKSCSTSSAAQHTATVAALPQRGYCLLLPCFLSRLRRTIYLPTQPLCSTLSLLRYSCFAAFYVSQPGCIALLPTAELSASSAALLFPCAVLVFRRVLRLPARLHHQGAQLLARALVQRGELRHNR